MIKKLTTIFFSVTFAVIFSAVYFTFSYNHSKNTFYDNKSIQPQTIQPNQNPKNVMPEPSKEISVITVGDIMLSRGVAKKIKSHNDLNYPFLKTRDYLKSGDIVFGNLESPITPGREIEHGEMIFRANPGIEKALAEANFSILSLANNHTPNFGQKGLLNTFKYLDQVGIKYVGAGKNLEEAEKPVFIEKNNIKFAFLAYNSPDVVPQSYFAGESWAGTAPMNIEKMTKMVKKAKEQADFVIVSMHAGNEYVYKPNQFQINFAHAAIDAGAELVIGHHPHVVQTIEKYKDKYIFYSLGNFVFDQMWSRATREGIIAKVLFNKNGVTKVDFTPVLIEDFCQPKILEGNEAKIILERLKNI